MRTTLTIDDDIAYGLKKELEKDPSKTFKQLVNEHLRRSLKTASLTPKKKRFKVKAYSLGLREGLDLDNIEELLDQIEVPFRR
ncbi:hypothetical protein [Leptolyngbya sp. 7M]|uniref:hypothetical protein n=1 Tax=Leptolyngbya sp. 7M TaxID=2812896 RepID=UPI001B8A9E47|nr:hypothetical protein [Leptolyngbya sp. 7M]QYO66676.1 hypothetical protein JVX88_07705 [Leptolyngbya sp. 7M]